MHPIKRRLKEELIFILNKELDQYVSQNAMAAALQIPQAVVSVIRSGGVGISIDRVERLLAVLGLTVKVKLELVRDADQNL